MVVAGREAAGDTHAEALLYAKHAFAWTYDDLEDALRLTHDSMFEALRDYIRATLIELAEYVPGEPMTLTEPRESWIAFEQVLEQVVAARTDPDRSGLAGGHSDVNG